MPTNAVKGLAVGERMGVQRDVGWMVDRDGDDGEVGGRQLGIYLAKIN